MKTVNVSARLNEREVGFKDIRLGQLFTLAEPVERYKILKGKVMIKIAKNRMQPLDDNSIRMTVESNPGTCNVVHIFATVEGE